MENLLVIRYKGSELNLSVANMSIELVSDTGDKLWANITDDSGFDLYLPVTGSKADEIMAAFNQVKQDGGISIIDVDEGDC